LNVACEEVEECGWSFWVIEDVCLFGKKEAIIGVEDFKGIHYSFRAIAVFV
jgi:hypothetical protein